MRLSQISLRPARYMGGTGLEPVTPSLSGIRPATERLSERERTLILAILATGDAGRELVIVAQKKFGGRRDETISTTSPSRYRRGRSEALA